MDFRLTFIRCWCNWKSSSNNEILKFHKKCSHNWGVLCTRKICCYTLYDRQHLLSLRWNFEVFKIRGLPICLFADIADTDITDIFFCRYECRYEYLFGQKPAVIFDDVILKLITRNYLSFILGAYRYAFLLILPIFFPIWAPIWVIVVTKTSGLIWWRHSFNLSLLIIYILY